MPWNIIMIFFVIGIFAGINSGKKDKKNSEEKEQKNGKIEI